MLYQNYLFYTNLLTLALIYFVIQNQVHYQYQDNYKNKLKVKIKLEKGTQSGKTLRLKGKGIPSVEGYRTGDLLVHINIWTPEKLTKEQVDFFKKHGNSEEFTPNPINQKSFFQKVKEMFN